ncbi:MAG: leucine-rich repeat protein [Bacteroidales bacterium]
MERISKTLEPHAVQVKRQKNMYIVLAIIEEKEEATASVPSVVSENDISDFVIESGVLTEYIGAGGNVVIPAGITSIGKKAFYKYSSLTGVTIGADVRSIERAAFDGCTRLAGVTLGNGVTNIKDFAFALCCDLISVTIGNSVESIVGRAFYGCGGLKEIHSKSPTPPKVGSSLTFGGSHTSPGVDKETCKLCVPFGAKTAYKDAEEWKDFKNIIEEIQLVADGSVRAYVSDNKITIEPIGTAEIRLNSGVYIVKAK